MKELRFPLPEEFYRFVEENKDSDLNKLRLEWHGKTCPFDLDLALSQIECRRKFAKKLPSFVKEQRFLFPSVVSGEQATNEFVARFHRELIEGHAKRVIDCTAGLGIDSITFAQSGVNVTAVERDLDKQQCLLHNAELFGLSNLRALCADSTVLFGKGMFDPETVIFIDPHRRDIKGKRVYGIKDCVPDVTRMVESWKNENVRVFLKLSPMLDIDQTIRDLHCVRRITAVCFKWECKELLVECDLRQSDKSSDNEIELEAIDLNEGGVISELKCSREFAKVHCPVLEDIATFEEGQYIYIPSAGMMKLGAWGAVCARFPGLQKLAPSTPIFVSGWYYRSFPGRVLTVSKVIGSSELKRLKGEHITVIARNYPLTAEELRKKAALKEGDSQYLVAVRTGVKSKPSLILCNRVDEKV